MTTHNKVIYATEAQLILMLQRIQEVLNVKIKRTAARGAAFRPPEGRRGLSPQRIPGPRSSPRGAEIGSSGARGAVEVSGPINSVGNSLWAHHQCRQLNPLRLGQAPGSPTVRAQLHECRKEDGPLTPTNPLRAQGLVRVSGPFSSDLQNQQRSRGYRRNSGNPMVGSWRAGEGCGGSVGVPGGPLGGIPDW